ncbi:MAG TPA: anti-sigma factor [Actinophytocola sp.]|jgi:anti-sigma-K factor RskA|uniref:anti-sigma factor n=1 Tax=Actinophytocola sp. TaxID=1872138 RepID=UPI002F92425E
MNPNMNADVHALTGAYVLDAVSPDERMVFERHLGDCDACRQEVTELRETASRLGAAVAEPPPPRLKASVMAQIRDTRQLPPEAPVVPLRRDRSPWALRLSAAAAVVLLVVSGVLGVLLVQARQSDEPTDAQAAAIAEIVRAGDARVVNQADADTGRMTALMSRSADKMLLLTGDLKAAPSGHDYQAWTIGSKIESAGLIQPDDGKAALEVSGIDAAQAVGITIEPAGGSDQPTSDPILTFEVT